MRDCRAKGTTFPCAAYYNEIEPYCVEWLRNLISAGLIADGEVDSRSIKDVQPEDLKGFTQCHFFAGIGGWSYAARLAGVSDDTRLWTGSCPCQPFSVVGQGKGTADERHLWPEFYRLISKCDPPTVFGEQVASKDGRAWLSGVRTDLEALGSAVGAADLCAASVGAPHIRQRLYWVADSRSKRPQEVVMLRATPRTIERKDRELSIMDEAGMRRVLVQSPWHDGFRVRMSFDRGMEYRPVFETVASLSAQSGICSVAHGVPGRVGKIRAFGNAIVPQVAAEFIQASLESISAASTLTLHV